MVSLTKIYTRSGDGGKTHLGNGLEVPKTDLRVEAFGTVDELNSVVGICVVDAQKQDRIHFTNLLLSIQNDLFDLGADLCVPEAENSQKSGDKEGQSLRITVDQVKFLEGEIDRHNDGLESLNSFVLPGGGILSCWLHLARTVCRRAERRCWSLLACEPVNEMVLVYLNRLSDLLFVLARVANNHGKDDVLWKPGINRSGDK